MKEENKTTGVTWCNRDEIWRSEIIFFNGVNNKVIFLGCFEIESDAIRMYEEAEVYLDIFDGDVIKFRRLIKKELGSSYKRVEIVLDRINNEIIR